LLIDDSQFGELGHAKLVADSLKALPVTELSLDNNGFTGDDVLMLLAACSGSDLRFLNLFDNKKVRDDTLRKAMQTLKPDGLTLYC
jgi:hypothetical protein